MKIVTNKDIWEEELGVADVILITTNSVVLTNNELVMGAGIAKEAKLRFPALPGDFGRTISEKRKVRGWYGTLCTSAHIYYTGPLGSKTTRIMAFQTKVDWKDPSPLELVKYSTAKLTVLALDHPDKRFALNYPAINNGGRTEEEILPIISFLPDNCIIYKKG